MSTQQVSDWQIGKYLQAAIVALDLNDLFYIVKHIFNSTALRWTNGPTEESLRDGRNAAIMMYRALFPNATRRNAEEYVEGMIERIFMPGDDLDEYIHLGESKRKEKSFDPSILERKLTETFEQYILRLANIKAATPESDDPEYADRGGSHYEEHPEEYQ